ncbi:hypothetical protein JAAARDRAFT_36704 [Jaapia argillacea MUCL 33604]|uniref:Casein kinase substrate phosphoprotein PP28 domain-containing protein n=1 Tax=Jaapia argillacea MUCL 33604 TaxID=933084 RepID=A0A067PM99_9AGAM|nr:hypothetical protein JAAARDRAFT_36704 [Jaapia argillacea MUCL 33604]
MARGAAGRGKFKTKRGGGRNFSKHIGAADGEDSTAAMDKWAARGENDDEEDSDEEEDSEEGSEEEESEDDGLTVPGSSSTAPKPGEPELTREERRQLKKQAKGKKDGDGETEDPYLVNANHAAGKNLSISDLSAPREMTRREREQKEKDDAKERWWKLHEQGKTDQAKADLARLSKIRAEREAAAARRKAETDAKAAEIEKKKAAGRK